MNLTADVIIIGAGAAGMMCAIEAGKRHRKVILLDHANKAGKKILMSGGGRCNFTNYYVSHENYTSHNPHFHKSALSRYTQWDFIELVKKHKIPFHEKTLGQLFCDNKSQDIVDMLLLECQNASVDIYLNTQITSIAKENNDFFSVKNSLGNFKCHSLVIATGGLSIPTMGATPFGYKVAEQFGIDVRPTRAGLVPLTLHAEDKTLLAPLSGMSVNSVVSHPRKSFQENILFTHRGLSGPAILQISSFWQPGEEISINLLPNMDLVSLLKSAQKLRPQMLLKTMLTEYLPKNLVAVLINDRIAEKPLQEISHQQFNQLSEKLQQWLIKPNGTEGYRTAEVTLGGVDSNLLSSKTMEACQIPGLYFIGEVIDIDGWLGGYNFQWAWASGWAAGQVV